MSMKPILKQLLLATFTLSMLIFTACTEDEPMEELAPENLSLNVEVSTTDPASVVATPNGDNVVSFTVFFGEDANETGTNVDPGSPATYTYSASGTYTVKAVAQGEGDLTDEITETVTITIPDPVVDPITLPVDFESATVLYEFTGFDGANTSVVENPASSGINTSSKVAATQKLNGAQTWAGSYFALEGVIDFGTNNAFKMKVNAGKIGVVKFKLENSTNPDINVEIDATSTVADEWEELTFVLSSSALTKEYDRIITFFDFGNEGDGTFYYFDDIELATVADVPLSLPVDFESSAINYSFTGFGGPGDTEIPTEVVDNPDATGANTSSKVAQVTKTDGSETWAGSLFELPAPIDFGDNNSFKIKVYSPKIGTIKFKLENATNSSIAAEVDVTNTKTNEWEELTYTFSNAALSGEYSKIVVFFDFGNAGDGSMYYYDDIQLTSVSTGEALALPIDFESTTLEYNFYSFGVSPEGTTPIVDNPDASGINTSAKVAEFLKTSGSQTWAGTVGTLDDAIDFTSSKTFKVKVWSPKSGIPVLLKIENATDNSKFYEVTVNTTTSNEWEEMSFDVSGADFNNSYHKVVLFFDFGTAGDDSKYYFDDISL